MENKTYSYKKSSQFRDMLNMSNKPNNILPYTDKQFEEDLKKWLSETKIIQNVKIKKDMCTFKGLRDPPPPHPHVVAHVFKKLW